MTKIINCYGGPGVGKSTTATGVFSVLKQNDYSCEYCSEYAKDVVWEETTKLLENQIHVFSEQLRRQLRLIGKVDYIITDCPILLCCVYLKRAPKLNHFSEKYIKSVEQFFHETYLQFDNVNWVIQREKKYDPKGRIQTLKEAKQIDTEIEIFLFEKHITYYTTNSKTAITDIVSKILYEE